MKFKLNLKSAYIEDATTWIGAVALATLVISIIIASVRYFASDKDKMEKVDLKAIDESPLYETPPVSNVETFKLEPESPSAQATHAAAKTLPAEKNAKEINPYAVWNYSGANGPGYWGMLDDDFKLCSHGQAQSPINLTGANENKALVPFKLMYGKLNGVMNNDGRLVSFQPNGKGTVLAFNTTYTLKRIDFHTPSEHRIDNLKFELEAQLIHVNQFGETLVIALLARETPLPNHALAELWRTLPEKKDQPVDVHGIALDSLFPKRGDYFYYEGSLTTPPCREKVVWAVMREPITISAQQLDRLLRVSKFNARPLQKLTGRTISRSW